MEGLEGNFGGEKNRFYDVGFDEYLWAHKQVPYYMYVSF